MFQVLDNSVSRFTSCCC